MNLFLNKILGLNTLLNESQISELGDLRAVIQEMGEVFGFQHQQQMWDQFGYTQAGVNMVLWSWINDISSTSNEGVSWTKILVSGIKIAAGAIFKKELNTDAVADIFEEVFKGVGITGNRREDDEDLFVRRGQMNTELDEIREKLLNFYYTQTQIDNFFSTTSDDSKVNQFALTNNVYSKSDIDNFFSRTSASSKVKVYALEDNVYSKTEADNTFATSEELATTDATVQALDDTVTAIEEDVKDLQDNKANASDLQNYATATALGGLDKRIETIENDYVKSSQIFTTKFLMDLMYPVNSIFISVECQKVVYNGSTIYIAPHRESYWWGEFVSSHPNHPLVFGTWDLIPNSNPINSAAKAGFLAVAAAPTTYLNFSGLNYDYIVSQTEIGYTTGQNDLTVQNLPRHAHKSLIKAAGGYGTYYASQQFAIPQQYDRQYSGSYPYRDEGVATYDEIGSLSGQNIFTTRGDQIDINPAHYNCFVYRKISLN